MKKKITIMTAVVPVTAALLRAFSFLHLEYKIENKGRNVTTGGFQLVTHMLLTVQSLGGIKNLNYQ